MLTTRSAFLRPLTILAALGILVSGLTGCRLFHSAAVTAKTPKKTAAPVQMLALDLTKVQPNEAGQIPILEYHDLVKGSVYKDYAFPAAEFRKDIEWLYAHNYRPISLSDYVNGKIDCPAGTSPVILTFDDALRGQFHYDDDGKIDPDCAVGILDAFHTQHPDWPLKGTFFVLTDEDPKMPPPFYQARRGEEKLKYLVQEGYEIGNHTVHHQMGMRHWPAARVESEFAGAVVGIHKYLPGYNVDTLALPFGVYPKDIHLVMQGESGGISYHNICAMEAGYGPAPSPMDKKFNPYRIERIIPANRSVKPGGPFTIRYWLKLLETHKAEKFISDGDPNTYTVSPAAKSRLNLARLQKDHFFLRMYQGQQLLAQK
jgi:peptidoglycan/xylan/chitin deacetylase (PgdA/CDA1 family)